MYRTFSKHALCVHVWLTRGKFRLAWALFSPSNALLMQDTCTPLGPIQSGRFQKSLPPHLLYTVYSDGPPLSPAPLILYPSSGKTTTDFIHRPLSNGAPPPPSSPNNNLSPVRCPAEADYADGGGGPRNRPLPPSPFQPSNPPSTSVRAARSGCWPPAPEPLTASSPVGAFFVCFCSGGGGGGELRSGPCTASGTGVGAELLVVPAPAPAPTAVEVEVEVEVELAAGARALRKSSTPLVPSTWSRTPWRRRDSRRMSSWPPSAWRCRAALRLAAEMDVTLWWPARLDLVLCTGLGREVGLGVVKYRERAC